MLKSWNTEFVPVPRWDWSSAVCGKTGCRRTKFQILATPNRKPYCPIFYWRSSCQTNSGSKTNSPDEEITILVIDCCARIGGSRSKRWRWFSSQLASPHERESVNRGTKSNYWGSNIDISKLFTFNNVNAIVINKRGNGIFFNKHSFDHSYKFCISNLILGNKYCSKSTSNRLSRSKSHNLHIQLHRWLKRLRSTRHWSHVHQILRLQHPHVR